MMRGVFVSAVNPKLIKDYGNNTLRKVKTDKADSRKIARYGIDNWAELRQHTPMDTIQMQLKTLNRQQSLYTKTKTMMKNNLIALLDPDPIPVSTPYLTALSVRDGSQKWVDFATTFWHVDCVRNMRPHCLCRALPPKWCKRHGYNFSQSKAVEGPRRSTGPDRHAPQGRPDQTMVRQAIDALNAISASMERLKAEMQARQRSSRNIRRHGHARRRRFSWPPQLVAELGDVTRFTHRNAITAFAGVDPGADQSGTHEAKEVRGFPKKGTGAAPRLIPGYGLPTGKHSPRMIQCTVSWTRNEAEGKPYLVYMTAGANKFPAHLLWQSKEYLASLEGN